MAFNGPAEDRLAIRELCATYGDAVSRRSAAEWGALWAEDGVWAMPGIPGMERIEGRETIVSTWIEGMKMFPFQANIQLSGSVEIEGHQATGRCYTYERVKDTDGKDAVWMNVYHDEYVKTGGKWLFKSRTLEILNITSF